MPRPTANMIVHATSEMPVGSILMRSVRFNSRFPEHNDWPERELWRNRIVRGIRLELGAIAIARPNMVTHTRWPDYTERSNEEAVDILQYTARPHAIVDGQNFDALTHRVAEARGGKRPRYHDAVAGFVLREYLRFLAGEPAPAAYGHTVNFGGYGQSLTARHGGSHFNFMFELPDNPVYVDRLIDRVHAQRQGVQ